METKYLYLSEYGKRKFLNKKLIVLSILVAAIIIVALTAEYFLPYDIYETNIDASYVLQPPSKEHILGTDKLGRDVFFRVLSGAKYSVLSSLALVLIVTIIGTIIGTICGYRGGKTDQIFMRISDIFFAIPSLVFAMAVSGVMGGGIINAVISLALISWPKYARLARSRVLAIKTMPYILSSKMAGSSDIKIMIKHILPNIAPYIIVTSMLDIGTMIMEIAALSFLGFGAKPPMAEWGSMMSEGRSLIQTTPWVIISPGIGIFITVIIFNLFGDALREALDPSEMT